MLHFEWPWAVALLPLPLFIRFLLPAAEPLGRNALRLPFFTRIAAIKGADLRGRRSALDALITLLIWLLLVLAATRPQWLGDPIQLPVSGRDLMLAVDISGSMEVHDFELDNRPVNRLQAVKSVAGEFIERREGDRIGLILFGSRAYLQAPLTFDRATVRRFLYEAEIGLAGKETAIGDAIGLAIKRMRERPEQGRVLILLTDGANTAGEVAPLDAARVAAGEGVKIYTIGIGSERGAHNPFFGPIRGQALDEESLIAIAERTGGHYFRARDRIELEGIYRTLDRMEPQSNEVETLRPLTALYPWPLATALFLSLLLAVRRLSY